MHTVLYYRYAYFDSIYHMSSCYSKTIGNYGIFKIRVSHSQRPGTNSVSFRVIEVPAKEKDGELW